MRFVKDLGLNQTTIYIYSDRKIKDAQMRATINQKLVETGERERFVFNDSNNTIIDFKLKFIYISNKCVRFSFRFKVLCTL